MKVVKKEKNRKKITKLPLYCPVCGSKTIKDKEEAVIRCANTINCDAQILGSLIHFVSKKSLNIEGLGEKQINQFYKLGFIKNFEDILIQLHLVDNSQIIIHKSRNIKKEATL